MLSKMFTPVATQLNYQLQIIVPDIAFAPFVSNANLIKLWPSKSKIINFLSLGRLRRAKFFHYINDSFFAAPNSD